MVNGYSIVTFQRPLKATDEYDLPIIANTSQAIVWAIGPLNQRQEVSYHSLYTRQTKTIQFGREPMWNCPLSESDMKMPDEEEDVPNQNDNRNSNRDRNQNQNQNPNQNNRDEEEPEYYDAPPNRQSNRNPSPRPNPSQEVSQQTFQNNRFSSSPDADRRGSAPAPPARVPQSQRNKHWEIPPIECYEPEDGVFYAQMGPTGGKQGYPAITGDLPLDFFHAIQVIIIFYSNSQDMLDGEFHGTSMDFSFQK